jgi:TetR/AcrR family transcriptional regulator, transcriptional repressor for nem operon
MARPREFDEGAALDGAIECFWRNGYETTSVRDLAHAMGINCTSLYNTFGNKRSVFVLALERYLDQSMRERINRIESSAPPKRAIRAFIAEIIRRSVADRDHRGCLLVNSAMEMAPHDRGLRRAIAARLGELEAFFRRCVVAAQRDGSVPKDRNPADLARLLLGVVLGIRVLARTNPNRALLVGLARPALKLLD